MKSCQKLLINVQTVRFDVLSSPTYYFLQFLSNNHRMALSKRKVLQINHFSQVKLPFLERRPSELLKKSLSKLRVGKLPISFHETITNQGTAAKSSALSQIRNPIVMEGAKQQIGEQQPLNAQYYATESQTFEEAIERNKDYLRQRRRAKKEEEKDYPSRKSTEQGREQSSRKKKRKGAIRPSERNQNDTGQQSRKAKKTPIVSRLEIKVRNIQGKLGKRKFNKDSRVLTEGQFGDGRSENLFDNIHNYLSDPHRKVETPPVKNLNQRKAVLEAKLKNLEQKTTSAGNLAQVGRPNFMITARASDYSYDDWRRVEIEKRGVGRQLSMRESSFEGELRQVNLLQQRNERSLERYLENQRLLNDLKMMLPNSER